jgi:uncharacterized membrane protein
MLAVRPAPKKALGTIIICLVLLSLSASLIQSVAAGSAWTRSDYVVAKAGDTVSFSIALFSTSSSGSESFTLSASGLPSGWSSSFYYGNSEINSINVKSGETVPVTMNVATNATTPAGNHTFTFTATSDEETIQYSLQVEIRLPKRQFSLTSPYPNATAEVGNALSYQVTVINNGETSEYVNLIATLPSNWSVSFLAANNKAVDGLYLMPGGSQSLTVQLTPPNEAGAGTYSFLINATSTDGLANATLSLSAYLYQAPLNSNVLISCTYPSVSAEEGLSFSFPITLTNKGSSDALLDLSCIAPEGWTVSYSAQDMSGMTLNNIYIAAGSSKALTFEATPPSWTLLGNYTLKLETLSSDGGANSSLVLTATVTAPTGEVKVESRYTQMTADVGTTLNYPITIENDRSTATTLNLIVASEPQGWSAVFLSGNTQVSNVLLTSKESISLVLQTTSPSSASIGNYTTIIGVQSTDGTVNELFDLNASLIGSYSLTATADAYNVQTTTGGTATVTVTVTNTGLSPVTSVKLAVTSPSSTWSAVSSPITVQSLAAGASATFTVQITSPSDAVAGDYLASITAVSDQVSSSAIAERVTLAASTTWVWVGVAIAIVAIILMLLLFRKYGRR